MLLCVPYICKDIPKLQPSIWTQCPINYRQGWMNAEPINVGTQLHWPSSCSHSKVIILHRIKCILIGREPSYSMCRKILWELHIHTVMSGLISCACAFIFKTLEPKMWHRRSESTDDSIECQDSTEVAELSSGCGSVIWNRVFGRFCSRLQIMLCAGTMTLLFEMSHDPTTSVADVTVKYRLFACTKCAHVYSFFCRVKQKNSMFWVCAAHVNTIHHNEHGRKRGKDKLS